MARQVLVIRAVRASDANDAMGASVPEVSTTQRAAAATSWKASAGLSAQRHSCVVQPPASASADLRICGTPHHPAAAHAPCISCVLGRGRASECQHKCECQGRLTAPSKQPQLFYSSRHGSH